MVEVQTSLHIPDEKPGIAKDTQKFWTFPESFTYDDSYIKDKREQAEAIRNIQHRLENHYPSWWKVYDKEGNRVWEMSLQDKAQLTKWRTFNSLPPGQQYKQLRAWADTHIVKDEHSAGEILYKVLFILIELIISLFAPEEEKRDQPAHQPA